MRPWPRPGFRSIGYPSEESRQGRQGGPFSLATQERGNEKMWGGLIECYYKDKVRGHYFEALFQ